MALPIAHPLDEVTVATTALSVATGIAGVHQRSVQGHDQEVGTMLGSVLSTADATVTTSIAGTAITGGAFVITQSGSAIGDLDAASCPALLPTALLLTRPSPRPIPALKAMSSSSR
jgi:hypothetical protein